MKKLTLLDSLIPVKDHHKPYNHPFLYETETSFIQDRHQGRMRIWNKCLTLTNDDDSFFDGSIEDGPPILEKVEPVIPVSSFNSTPPMPEILKKNQKPDPNLTADSTDDSSISKCAMDKKSKRRSHRKTKLRISAVPDLADTDSLDKLEDVSVKHVKSLGNYFSAFDRTGYGKGFYMMGKCFEYKGPVDYMIKWDQWVRTFWQQHIE